jgi:hypothetical protein
MTKRMTNSRNHNENLEVLEAQLAGTLRTIAPPNDIIQRLRERIHMPSRDEITLRLTDWRRLFLVFGGVISGMLLLITVARAFYYLSGRKDPM